MNTVHQDLEPLVAATKGLLYLSETDAPLSVVELPLSGQTVEDSIRQLPGVPAGATVEIQDLAYFFRNQVRPASDNAEDRHRAARFESLTQLIRQTLPDARVYRVGTVAIDAFIIGTLSDGTRGGLRTKLVET